MPQTHAGWTTRGYLPHFDAAGAAQHIVFRLADSLPASLVERMRRSPVGVRLETAEAALDAGAGARLLTDPGAARIVQEALLHFDQDRYALMAWCIMPTHVHALILQGQGWRLSDVVHAWKSFTAHAVNQALRRSGPIWARDYFDRAARGDRQAEAMACYIEHNPVSAGLVAAPEAWPWSSARRQ